MKLLQLEEEYFRIILEKYENEPRTKNSKKYLYINNTNDQNVNEINNQIH